MISQADARSFLEKDVTDLEIDTVIGLFENATGGLYNYDDAYVELIFPDEKDVYIFPKLHPILSLTKIEELIAGDWELVDPTTYSFTDRKIFDVNLNEWSYPIRVTYEGGYDETTCPQEIKTALAVQIGFMSDRLDSHKLAVDKLGISTGATTTFLDADYHPLFKRMVEKYRRYG